MTTTDTTTAAAAYPGISARFEISDALGAGVGLAGFVD